MATSPYGASAAGSQTHANPGSGPNQREFTFANGPSSATFGKRPGSWEDIFSSVKAIATVPDARYVVTASDDWGRVVDFRSFEDRDLAVDYAHELAMQLPVGNSMTSGHPRGAMLYTRAPGYASIADQHRTLTFFKRTPTGVEERTFARDVDGSPAVRRATRQPSNDLPSGTQREFTFANGPYRGLTVAERDAVRAYAADHGRGWRRDLADDWSRGRTTSDLQRLRNDLGPSWLAHATLPNGPGAGTYPNRASAHLLADLDNRGRRDLALDLMQYTALPDVVHLWGSYEDSQFDRAALVQKLAAVYERAYGDVMYVLTGRRLGGDFWVPVVRDDVFNQIEQAGFEGRSLPNGGDRLPPLAYSEELQSYRASPRLPPLAYGAGPDGDPYAGRDLYPSGGYGDLATPTALRPRFGRRGL
jgi:hypothetical protein